MQLRDPLIFDPIFMERIWGGRRLESVLGKRLPGDLRIGESWEICDHGIHSSVIANGPLRGRSLADIMAASPEALLGSAGAAAAVAGRFPILVKWIDAREKLSIQVHPPDGHARLLKDETGKTECWFVADADSGAEIFVGVRRGIDRAALMHELARGTVDACLNRIPVRPGDFIFVPAGTPHAIGAGVLLAEIQQTSDTTFRLFDWNRVDSATGLPRALHVEEALESIDFSGQAPEIKRGASAQGSNSAEMLLAEAECPYFVVARRFLNSPELLGDPDRFHILMALSGAGRIAGDSGAVSLKRGDCALLPASGRFRCEPLGSVELLDAWVPGGLGERPV